MFAGGAKNFLQQIRGAVQNAVVILKITADSDKTGELDYFLNFVEGTELLAKGTERHQQGVTRGELSLIQRDLHPQTPFETDFTGNEGKLTAEINRLPRGDAWNHRRGRFGKFRQFHEKFDKFFFKIHMRFFQAGFTPGFVTTKNKTSGVPFNSRKAFISPGVTN